MPSTDTVAISLEIAGVTEPTISSYFATLNAGNFDATAGLFAVDGIMYPPFESGIVGPEAIATYLKQEALDMRLEPREGTTAEIDDQLQVQIKGRVQTSWCGVNVGWLFALNQQRQITAVRIKLLASPQELLNLRR